MIRPAPLRSAFLAGLACLVLAGAAASPALADIAASKAAVDAAKARGVVGEQADGFLGVVSGGDASIRGAVAEVNAGRAAAYRDAAAKTGVSADAAGQATARQLIERTPPGQYYKGGDGAWTKK